VILGQKIDGKDQVICYMSKTLNGAQLNYSTTKNEILVVVFTFTKFTSYLLCSQVIIKTDHTSLIYLMEKKDSKLRLIR
jgi:hypothetical protein